MSMESEVRAILMADSTVTDFIGTRLYPLWLPAGVTLPAATYQRIFTNPVNVLNGAHGTEVPLLQIDAYADSYSAAEAIALVLSAALSGITGNGNIQAITLSNMFPLYDVELNAYRYVTEFRVSYDT